MFEGEKASPAMSNPMRKNDTEFNSFPTRTLFNILYSGMRQNHFFAELYIEMGDGQKSVKHFEKILEIAPAHAGAIRLCGIAYLHQGRFDEALPLLEKTVGFDPTDTYYQFNYAACLTELGQQDKAIEIYASLEEKDPDNPIVMCAKGMSQTLKKEYSVAMSTFNAVIKLYPKNYMPYHYIGLLFMKMETFHKAEKAFSKAILLDATIAELHSNLGICFIGQELKKEAIAALSKAVELSSLERYKLILAKAKELWGFGKEKGPFLPFSF